MALVRITRQDEDQGEAVKPATGGVGTGELNRITTNQTLADHVGKFVAGEVASQFRNESLSDMLKGKNMIMISGSWG